jgi:hypothetical protein
MLARRIRVMTSRAVAFGPEFGKIVGDKLIVAVGLKHKRRVQFDGFAVAVHNRIAVTAVGLMHYH